MKDEHTIEESPRAGRKGGLPPGTSLDLMDDACVGCGDCVAVCPSSVLQLDAEGLPRLIKDRGCGLCGLCEDVCMHGAIQCTPAMLRGLRRTMRIEREMNELLR